MNTSNIDENKLKYLIEKLNTAHLLQNNFQEYFDKSIYDDFYSAWTNIPVSESKDHFSSKNNYPSNNKIWISSGGSSGTPKSILLSHEEVLKNCEIHGKGYVHCGIQPNDLVATFGLPNVLTSEFTVILALLHTHAGILPIGDVSNPENVIKLLEKFKPSVLLVMPSDFLPVANTLLLYNKRLEFVNLFIFGGEPLRNSDKEKFMQALSDQTQFRSVFQSSDCGSIGYQCFFCKENEYHIHEETQFIEIINQDSFSKTGELLVTNLTRVTTPVVRMKTGDLAKYSENSTCLCGNTSKKIILCGRSGNELKIGGEKVNLNILNALRDELNINSDDFYIEISKDKNLLDKINIYSNSLKNNLDKENYFLTQFFSKCPKLKLQVDLSYLSQPEIFEFNPINHLKYTNSGKIKFFEDVRK